MKAHVSTMLTESDLSIPLPVRHFKCLVRRKAGCKPTSTVFRVFSVLTTFRLEARSDLAHCPLCFRLRLKR